MMSPENLLLGYTIVLVVCVILYAFLSRKYLHSSVPYIIAGSSVLLATGSVVALIFWWDTGAVPIQQIFSGACIYGLASVLVFWLTRKLFILIA